MNELFEKLAIGAIALAVGMLLGAGAVFWLDSGRLAERDRILMEYNRLRGEYDESVRATRIQAGRVTESLRIVGNGIQEALVIAGDGKITGGSAVDALKKLARNLEAIQGRIGTLERDYDTLWSEYRSLSGMVGAQVE